jgi:PAS domain S-box-containing protein
MGWLPLVVAALGTAATVVTTRSVWQVNETRTRNRFEQVSAHLVEELRMRLRSYIALLSGSAGLFSGSADVTPDEFERYMARIWQSESFPGVEGIGFVRYLRSSEAAEAHLARMRERFGQGFGFSPAATDQGVRSIVDYIEPGTPRNRAALGWDMWSEPTTRGAMERARNSGRPASTSIVNLKGETETEQHRGILLFVPVYSTGGVPESGEERTRTVTGFTYCPFRIDSMISRFVPIETHEGLTLEVRDGKGESSVVLYSSGEPAFADPDLTREFPIQVADQTWNVRCATGASFQQAGSHLSTWITGAFGALFTASFAGMAYVRARSRMHRDRAASRVAESENRYRLLATATASIVWTTDAEGRFIARQDSWQNYTGQTWDDHRDRGWLEAVYASDRERLQESWKAARESRAAFEFEGRLWSRTARSHRWFVMRGVPMLGPDGTIREWVGLVRDIQERRTLEEHLLQSRKLESLGRLAGGVAHDFNNLLTAIIGSADLIDMESRLTESSREYLRTIREAANRSAVLTQHLLAFARKQVIEPRTVEINSLVHDLVPILKRLLGEDVQLVTSLPTDTGVTRIDPGQLEQVLVNLATNARDAMPQGGILTIQTSNAELDEEYTRGYEGVAPGRYIMLLVSDTGVGMDTSIQQHIFEPFFTTKEGGKGTGLGLATCYGIIRQAGGFIWLYSEPGKGTLFRIFLPRVDGQAERAGRAKEETPGFGTETVLLVEDEPMVRQIATAALRGFGYSVLVAASGEEALAIANAFAGQIHLMVTDVVLPGMSGKELSERLRAVRPSIDLLFCSGYTDSVITQRGVLDTGIAFLQKPYTPKQLARRVRGILDKVPDGGK